MNEKQILDAPENSTAPLDQWKAAAIAVVFLFTSLLLSHFILDILAIRLGDVPAKHLTFLGLIVGALYIFIKKIDYENISIGRLFLWSVFILFMSIFPVDLITNYINEGRFLYTPKMFFTTVAMDLVGSVILGNVFSIGVLQWIKNNNRAMLLLMFFMGMMFLTYFS